MFFHDPNRGRWLNRAVDAIYARQQEDGSAQIIIRDTEGKEWPYGPPRRSSGELVEAFKELGIETTGHDAHASAQKNAEGTRFKYSGVRL